MPPPGTAFEVLVAQIQARIDPAAKVAHNEYLIDRLGQRRQFDVVIRGTFAGQSLLGVIECKDLKRKMGTPEVDAFNTKALDINANFKLLASRKGFTRQALEKARHYGIKAISLLDPSFQIGDWWSAKVTRWSRLSIDVQPADTSAGSPAIPPDQLQVAGGRVLDWFTNHLLQEGHKYQGNGWVVGFQMCFDPPIEVTLGGDGTMMCSAISFRAERECLEYERFVPLSAEAFVDWHSRSATIPANTTVRTEDVPADLRAWPVREKQANRTSFFMPVAIEAHEHQFDVVSTAPNLESF